MTQIRDLRKYYCNKCAYQGWLIFDENGDRFVRVDSKETTNYKGEKLLIETEYTYAKMCECLIRIRAGDYDI